MDNGIIGWKSNHTDDTAIAGDVYGVWQRDDGTMNMGATIAQNEGRKTDNRVIEYQRIEQSYKYTAERRRKVLKQKGGEASAKCRFHDTTR